MLEYAKLVLAVESAQARTAKRDLDALTEAGGRAEKSAKGMQGAYSALKGAFLALGVTTIVGGIIQQADSYQMLQGRLALTTRSTAELTRVQKELFDLSQRTATSVQDQTELYIGLSGAASELGATQAQLLKFTEGVGNALRLSGTSAQGASSAILQLTQLIGGSVVQAQEFNTLLDNGRTILVAVANNLDKAGGSVGKLRALVKDGKVSSAEFFEAFLKGADDINKAAGSIQRTVGQAFTQLKNELFNTVGKSDTSPIVEALDDLRETLKDEEFQRSLLTTTKSVLELAGAIGKLASVPVKIGQGLGSLAGRVEQNARELGAAELIKKGAMGGPPRILYELASRVPDSEFRMNYPDGPDALLSQLGLTFKMPRSEYVTGGEKPPYIPPGRLTSGGLGGGGGAGEEAQRKVSEAERLIKSLQEEVALYGDLTELQKIEIALANDFYGKVPAEQQQQLKNLAAELDFKNDLAKADQERIEAENEKNQKILETRSALEDVRESLLTDEERFRESYQRRIDIVVRAADDQLITEERKVELITKLHLKMFEELEEAQDQSNEYSRRAAENIQDVFADFLFDPFEDGLEGMVRNFARAMQRMMAEAAAAELLGALFGSAAGGGKGATSGIFGSGGLGNILGNFLSSGLGFLGFGGGKAGAVDIGAQDPFGPVVYKQFASGGLFGPGWAMVGENGPEMVRFNGSGRVYNNGETAAMQTGSNVRPINVHVGNISIQAPDTSTGRQTAMQAGLELGRGIQAAMRRNG